MRNKEDYLTVTQVLSPFSGLSAIDPDVLRNAANRGTVVHLICDAIASKQPVFEEWLEELIKTYTRNEEHFDKERNMVRNLMSSFINWSKGKKFLKRRERFFDDELMLTGECDLFYKNNEDKIVLVDLKTPISESKTWLLQGSAYSYLAKREGVNVEIIEFVKLDRKGAAAVSFFYEENFSLFRSALETYKYFYKNTAAVNPLDYI